MLSTPTISGHWSVSSEPSLTPSLSPPLRHENFVPRSIFDPTSPTRTSSPLPSPRKSWHEYERSSQTSRRQQCPRVHYHPYCDECQTLMGCEPRRPTRLTSKRSTMSFGRLKEYCESLPMWRELKMQSLKKMSVQWREEQFARAVYKRNAAKAAREAQRRQAHRQRMDRGAALPVLPTGTQMSTHS